MSIKESGKEYVIDGKRLFLRTLRKADASEKYLGWLNDPEVQKFTRRRDKISSMRDVIDFINSTLLSPDFHFAIFLKEDEKHIGNISLNSIDEQNKSGEISIMIGDRSVWGQGLAREAIELMTKFAFTELNLHRLWAESPNLAFNILIAKLGWVKEGVRRQAFYLEEKFLDLECWSILKTEYGKQNT